MSKHDYTKHSNKNKYENKSRIERKFESADKMVEELNNQMAASEPEVVVPSVSKKKTPKNLGKVIDCVKLNVREEPNTKAFVVFEIAVGSTVFIDEAGSTDEFYKICTEHGVEGYCMKKFIEI